jgi:hypothetical protein
MQLPSEYHHRCFVHDCCMTFQFPWIVYNIFTEPLPSEAFALALKLQSIEI